MAATGTEYVTLEQLKDLVTNMIQPLVDAVGTWDKSEHGGVSMAEFCENMIGAYSTTLPIRISETNDNVAVSNNPLFSVNANGERTQYPYLGNLIANLLLAAPNGDHTQLFGYLGDNTQNLITTPTVRSSAALTYAAESGGSTDVPVGTLSVQGEYNQMFAKTSDGDKPVSLITMTSEKLNPPNITKPTLMINTDADSEGKIDPITLSEPGEPYSTEYYVPIVSLNSFPLESSELASARTRLLYPFKDTLFITTEISPPTE